MFVHGTGYVNHIKDTAPENVSTTQLQAPASYIKDALLPALDMCRSSSVGRLGVRVITTTASLTDGGGSGSPGAGVSNPLHHIGDYGNYGKICDEDERALNE